MPWDSQINPDLAGVPASQQSAGPRLGFLSAFDASWDAQMRASSRDGLAYFFAKLDDEQADRARKAGKDYTPMYMQLIPPNTEDWNVVDASGKAVPQYKDHRSRWTAYRDMADSIVFGKDNGWAEYMRAHDEHIAKLNAEDPTLNLKSTTQMFDEVRMSAQRAEQRGQLPVTWGGLVGSFAGGMVGAVDPRTDIFNTLTLAVGGFGKTAAVRIGTQMAGQGAIEAVNQLTGVQHNRELLGLEHGVGNALWQIGGAAAGGAAIQGVGEAAIMGLRRWRTGRWFDHTPTDPAPPPPAPSGPVRTTPEFERAWERTRAPQQRSDLYASPVGRPRADADMDHVYSSLSDWGGPRAWEIRPSTDTRVPSGGEKPFTLNVDRGVENIDSIARRVDPEVFQQYDKLVKLRETLRGQVNDVDLITRVSDTAAAAGETRAQIAEMRQRLDTTTGRARKNLETKISDAEASYQQHFKDVAPETPGTPVEYRSKLQQDLLRTERQLIDMRPAVRRAYAHAQNEWYVSSRQRQQIDDMFKAGDSGIAGKAASSLPEKMPDWFVATARDHVPEMQNMQIRPGETIAQAVVRSSEEAAKAAEEALATFQGTVGKLSDMEHVEAERVRLNSAVEAAEAKLVGLKGKDLAVAKHELRALQDERESLDTFKMTVDGKDFTLSLDGDRIVVPDEKGGTRIVTARELLKDIEDDNNMLKAVTTCSLKGTS